ncbi:MAG: hypothetical protein KGI94_03440 [Paracoccaceae bacterium]|nr:hypothetical protein [Paracoccaceae bacterium]
MAGSPRLVTAQLDPADIFETPRSVLEAEDFSREQKIAVLRHWAYHAGQPANAQDRNARLALLEEILMTLSDLGIGTGFIEPM